MERRLSPPTPSRLARRTPIVPWIRVRTLCTDRPRALGTLADGDADHAAEADQIAVYAGQYQRFVAAGGTTTSTLEGDGDFAELRRRAGAGSNECDLKKKGEGREMHLAIQVNTCKEGRPNKWYTVRRLIFFFFFGNDKGRRIYRL